MACTAWEKKKGSYVPDTFRSGLIRGDIEDYEPWKADGADQSMPAEGEKDKTASHSDYEVDANEKDVWEQPGAERFSTLHECLSLERDMIIGDEAFDEFPGYIDKGKVEKRIDDAGFSFSEKDQSESDIAQSQLLVQNLIQVLTRSSTNHCNMNKTFINGRTVVISINIAEQKFST